MIPTINSLVAAWIETLGPDQTASAWQDLMKLKDGSRRYLHDCEGTAFADLGWKALTIARDGPFVGFGFHRQHSLRDRMPKRTNDDRTASSHTAHRPQRMAIGPQHHSRRLEHRYPTLTLRDSSTEKGVTSLVLQLPNKRIK